MLITSGLCSKNNSKNMCKEQKWQESYNVIGKEDESVNVSLALLSQN